MAVVNTNVNATVAQNALVRNEREMNTAMERLSTGKRINGAKDDAAGLAISSRMTLSPQRASAQLLRQASVSSWLPSSQAS